jgi:hypothetical protein
MVQKPFKYPDVSFMMNEIWPKYASEHPDAAALCSMELKHPVSSVHQLQLAMLFQPAFSIMVTLQIIHNDLASF